MNRVVYGALCSALIIVLAACSGRGNVDEELLPTRVPTLAAADFAATLPTATPVPAEPTATPEPIAPSAEITATEEVTGTDEVTATEEVSASAEISTTQEATASEEVSATETMTATESLTGTTEVTVTPELTTTEEFTEAAEIAETGEITTAPEITSTEEITDSEEITATDGVTDTEATGEPSATSEATPTRQATATATVTASNNVTETATIIATAEVTATQATTTTEGVAPEEPNEVGSNAAEVDEAPAEEATDEESSLDPALAGLPAEVLMAMANADPVRGQQLTLTNACIACHTPDPNLTMVGPTWHNLATTAESRIEGMGSGLYLYSSITHPNDYIVEDYQPNVMLQIYSGLPAQDLADLISYLLTLKEGS